MPFDHDKKQILNRKDKSSIHEIDSDIRKLVSLINKHSDYYTTSSCSGWIVQNPIQPRPGAVAER